MTLKERRNDEDDNVFGDLEAQPRGIADASAGSKLKVSGEGGEFALCGRDKEKEGQQKEYPDIDILYKMLRNSPSRESERSDCRSPTEGSRVADRASESSRESDGR